MTPTIRAWECVEGKPGITNLTGHIPPAFYSDAARREREAWKAYDKIAERIANGEPMYDELDAARAEAENATHEAFAAYDRWQRDLALTS